VKEFFNLMELIASPAGARWAALLYGAGWGAAKLLA
jgi:hypothetical protein